MGSYSNRQDLADALVSALTQLRKAQEQSSQPARSVRSGPVSARPRRVVDRLTGAELEGLIAAGTEGASKRQLAGRYGISESSVKRLIRIRIRDGCSIPSSTSQSWQNAGS